MKRIALTLCFLAGLSFSNFAHAQVSVSVSFNVEAQPEWGPTGYDHVNYYYMPDIETYYYVPRHQFVYLNAGKWVFTSTLPQRYHGYDLYRGYKVVLNEPRPYLHHEEYRTRYAHYRAYYDHQPALREHRNKHDDHEDHDEDGPGNGHGQGHAYGHYKKDHVDKEK